MLDIDDCPGSACENGGVCKDGVNEYTCQCLDGFSGTYCQEGEEERSEARVEMLRGIRKHKKERVENMS